MAPVEADKIWGLKTASLNALQTTWIRVTTLPWLTGREWHGWGLTASVEWKNERISRENWNFSPIILLCGVFGVNAWFIHECLPVDLVLVVIVPDNSSASRWCVTHTDPQGAEGKTNDSRRTVTSTSYGSEYQDGLKGESEIKRGDVSACHNMTRVSLWTISPNLCCQVPNKSCGWAKQPFRSSFLDIFLKSLGAFCLVNKASIDRPVRVTFWRSSFDKLMFNQTLTSQLLTENKTARKKQPWHDL